ncbi:hypothetical protein HYPSUDRAFT_38139 [Hypholoma sublateritium FD-334 SS-4]|uniref:C2H2-type domain-containing protein n=1 Tax=Hypholoma sublateritium (strain FD-334 SS-4) TaxID=945553 RepID=A0A0D2P9E7_HYPSF|nr:hypothetical protein HYPSUDRAFT_38139 [Hypholoma sublateritium FD-334 SS-4]
MHRPSTHYRFPPLSTLLSGSLAHSSNIPLSGHPLGVIAPRTKDGRFHMSRPVYLTRSAQFQKVSCHCRHAPNALPMVISPPIYERLRATVHSASTYKSSTAPNHDCPRRVKPQPCLGRLRDVPRHTLPSSTLTHKRELQEREQALYSCNYCGSVFCSSSPRQAHMPQHWNVLNQV